MDKSDLEPDPLTDKEINNLAHKLKKVFRSVMENKAKKGDYCIIINKNNSAGTYYDNTNISDFRMDGLRQDIFVYDNKRFKLDDLAKIAGKIFEGNPEVDVKYRTSYDELDIWWEEHRFTNYISHPCKSWRRYQKKKELEKKNNPK